MYLRGQYFAAQYFGGQFFGETGGVAPTQPPTRPLGYLPIYINNKAPRKHRKRQEKAAESLNEILACDIPSIAAETAAQMQAYLDEQRRIDVERATRDLQATEAFHATLTSLKGRIADYMREEEEDEDFLMMSS